LNFKKVSYDIENTEHQATGAFLRLRIYCFRTAINGCITNAAEGRSRVTSSQCQRITFYTYLSARLFRCYFVNSFTIEEKVESHIIRYHHC
jgi:hypothetical protein